LTAHRTLILSAAVVVILTLSPAAFARRAEAEQDQQPQQQPAQQPSTVPVHAAATVYSPGYETRGKIHKYASFASLPLFAAELYLGEKTYNSPTTDNSYKGAHIAVGTGIVGLFGVNSVTGVMNLWEARHDPEGRTVRLVHGILMMAADAGFVATVATAPGGGHNHGVPVPTVNLNNRSVHRDIAIGSISVGTVGYLMMLLVKH
jgi:hypothetical protein